MICRVKSVKLKCGHHKKCINKWKFMNDSCCLCKRLIETTKRTFLITDQNLIGFCMIKPNHI